MLRVTTKTGSIYFIDTENKRAARIWGDEATKSTHAKDGEFRSYARLIGPAIGEPLGILWDGKLFGKMRLTTPVVSIQDEPSEVVE